MSVDPKRVQSVFALALEARDPAGRVAILDRECANDSELRHRVEELLNANDAPSSFFVDRTGAFAPNNEDQHIDLEGTTIAGRYKLLEQIGEGGMGTVWVAEQQEPVKRQVALKLIKPGMDSKTVLSRFEAERQALALMDHPNIAKVLDGGRTEQGRPYFVMEYVKGVPITQYCDDAQLTVRQRLELLLPVFQAVQHAHQKGIIHRDLKPSNILVCLYDGRPVPKVIDFGLAKALHQPLTEQSLHTAHGIMLGTPLYMSPEQAEFNNLDVDTRTDIYSLGVIFYELLTGSTPLEKQRLKDAAYQEIIRLIKEDEPPKPSTRLSGSGSLPSVAAQRHIEPAKLSKLVRGELDWIVMKALEKDRNRRYETANSFAMDVQRYLADEPVQACSPSKWYRLRKFVRRNRRAVVAGSMVLLALVIGVIGTTVALIQAKLERDGKDKALASEQRIAYFRRVALAQHEFEDYNVGRANQLLDECPDELRGWEWHYLQRLRYGNSPVFKGHTDQVTGVAISPNGRLIASAGGDPVVTTWDVATGQRHAMKGRADKVWCVAFSPVGLRLASGGGAAVPVARASNPIRFLTPATRAGQVQIWDATTKEVDLTIMGHSDDVTKVAFSPDGQWLASASRDGTVKIWDSRTGAEKLTLNGHTEWVTDVTFSRDGRYLATASRDKTVRTWNAETGRPIDVFEGHREWVCGVTFNQNGQKLASASYDSTVRVWDLNARNSIILGNPCPTMAVAFSPDGQRLASAGWDKTVKIWDPETGEEILTLRGHTQAVTALTFSGEDGRRLVSGSDDRTVRLWDATLLGGRLPFELYTLRHTDSVSVLAYSRDGRFLASAGLGQTVSVWEPNMRQLVCDLKGHTSMIWGIAFSCDGRRLASASWDRTVRVWETSTRQCTTLQHEAAALAVAFAPKGEYLASSSYDGIVKIWDPIAGTCIGTIKVENTPPINALAYSPDSKYLVTGAEDGLVRVWNAETYTELPFSPLRRGHSDCVQGVAFSPDGLYIASASYDGTAKIWDAKAGRLIRTLQVQSKQRVPGIAFSPDSNYLATAGLDGTVRIWGVDTGDELRTLRGHNSMVWCVAFSPDGKQLAAGGGHYGKGDIRIWDVMALDLDSAAQNK